MTFSGSIEMQHWTKMSSYKSEEIYYKLGQVLQIGAILFLTGAGITSRVSYYKLVENIGH